MDEKDLTKRLSDSITKRIADNKRLTKFDMAYELYRCSPIEYAPVYNYLDSFKRSDVVLFFNAEFNVNVL